MDPLSQGLFGAAAAGNFAKKHTRLAIISGIIAGMAADLDVLIKSSTDPMLAIEFHRHFSHSIFFIPFGGFLVAGFLWLISFKKFHFKDLFILSTIAYATHGFLDAATSYGTLLFWPFYNERISFDIISIIDPLFTIPIFILIIIAIGKNSHKLARIAFIYSLFYLAIGQIQHIRAENYLAKHINNQEHKIEKLKLNPTIGNLILWRSVYEYDDNYYINAIYMPYLKEPKLYQGEAVEKLDLKDLTANLSEDSPIYSDLIRFNRFSQGFIYKHPDNQNIIADLRYGTLPNDQYSLWGIKLDKTKPKVHSEYVFLREFSPEHISRFKEMLQGK